MNEDYTDCGPEYMDSRKSGDDIDQCKKCLAKGNHVWCMESVFPKDAKAEVQHCMKGSAQDIRNEENKKKMKCGKKGDGTVISRKEGCGLQYTNK